jgi:hypothetical protein
MGRDKNGSAAWTTRAVGSHDKRLTAETQMVNLELGEYGMTSTSNTMLLIEKTLLMLVI